MMKTVLLASAVAIVVGFLPTLAFADGDAVAGKTVFNKCKACHDAVAETKKIGPHLVGIVGRATASVEGFAYSDGMKAKGTEGQIWTEENIAAYLKAPKEFVPGNKMPFAGLKDDTEIANLIAYLKASPKPE
jgi:cytochrome c